VGDAGLALFRPNKDGKTVSLVFASEIQLDMNDKVGYVGSKGMNAEMAEDGKLEYQDGDILAVYSNGLSDNINPSGMV